MNHVESMFEHMESLMRRLKKASYEVNMQTFRNGNGAYFDEMLAGIKNADDKKAAAEKTAADFTGQILNSFSVKGKINGRTQADLNLFMIYYVFPAILLTHDENAKLLADSIRDKWRVTFKDSSRLDYADYDSIHNSFREKIFGIF